MKHSLDRYTCGTYTMSTVVDGLSVLCEAVSLVNEWRLGLNYALFKTTRYLSVTNCTKET